MAARWGFRATIISRHGREHPPVQTQNDVHVKAESLLYCLPLASKLVILR